MLALMAVTHSHWQDAEEAAQARHPPLHHLPRRRFPVRLLPLPPRRHRAGNSSTGHPHGMWSTLPTTMPINPIHAALLHTGKILLIAGSGNCPPQQAGCPQGPQYPAGCGTSGPL